MSFQSFIGVAFRECIVAPPCVDLIPGASRAVVLSDVGTDAARPSGELSRILVGWAKKDRDPSGAMRPEQACLGRESFSPEFMFGAAKLFTSAAGRLLRERPRRCGITLETVSAKMFSRRLARRDGVVG